MAPHPDDQGPDTIEVTDARQGRPGKRVLAILLASAGAAAFLLILVLIFSGPKLDASKDGEAGPEATQAFDAA